MGNGPQSGGSCLRGEAVSIWSDPRGEEMCTGPSSLRYDYRKHILALVIVGNSNSSTK
jgi:hypothetical protein